MAIAVDFQDEIVWLFDDVLLLPRAGAKTGPTGRPPNAYSLLADGKQFLIDAPFMRLLPTIRRLAEEGHTPAALILTHWNLVSQADALEAIRDELRVPIVLHPDDAAHESAVASGIDYAAPKDVAVLDKTGVEIWHFRGHTAGSIVLYWPGNGGVVFAGDSCVGNGPKDPEGSRYVIRIPPDGCIDEPALRDNWRRFNRPVAGLLPLHGAIYTARDDGPLDGFMETLRREEPSEGM